MSKTLKMHRMRCLLLLITLFSFSQSPMLSADLENANVLSSSINKLDPENSFWSSGVKFSNKNSYDLAMRCFCFAETELLNPGRRWTHLSVLCDQKQLGCVLLDKAACAIAQGRCSDALEALMFTAARIKNDVICSLAISTIVELKKADARLSQMKWWGSPESEAIRTAFKSYASNFAKLLLSKDRMLFMPSTKLLGRAAEEERYLRDRLAKISPEIFQRSIVTTSGIRIFFLNEGDFDPIKATFEKKSLEDGVDFGLKFPLKSLPKIFSLMCEIAELEQKHDYEAALEKAIAGFATVLTPGSDLENYENATLLASEALAISNLILKNDFFHDRNQMQLLQYLAENIDNMKAGSFFSPNIIHEAKKLAMRGFVNGKTILKETISLCEDDPFEPLIVDMGNCYMICSTSKKWLSEFFKHFYESCMLENVKSDEVMMTPSGNIFLYGSHDVVSLIENTRVKLYNKFEQDEKKGISPDSILDILIPITTKIDRIKRFYFWG